MEPDEIDDALTACDEWQTALPDQAISTEKFKREDIESVAHYDPGDNDGPDLLAVVKLKDGRFASIVAWRDYTGWGCQDGGTVRFASDYEQAVRFGLTAEERERLKIVQPDQP